MAGQTDGANLGRPPKPQHLQRRNRVVLLLTDDEVRALDEYIASGGYADRNDFARDLILEKIGYQRKPNA